MDSSQRQALGLVRLVAGALLLVGILDGGLYFTQYIIQYNHFRHHQASMPSLDIARIILDSIPLIAGLVIFGKARAVAEWVSDLIE